MPGPWGLYHKKRWGTEDDELVSILTLMSMFPSFKNLSWC